MKVKTLKVMSENNVFYERHNVHSANYKFSDEERGLDFHLMSLEPINLHFTTLVQLLSCISAFVCAHLGNAYISQSEKER